LINVLGAHASPWQTTSRSISGAPVTHGGGPNGQSSTGSPSCSRRNPVPIARAQHARQPDKRRGPTQPIALGG
jgi:hypothetical protein